MLPIALAITVATRQFLASPWPPATRSDSALPAQHADNATNADASADAGGAQRKAQPEPAQPGASMSLLVPVEGVRPQALRRQFDEARSGGRQHRAIDIPAQRGTPVLAATDGTIARLVKNELGGLTIYQRDPSGTRTFYYAHLQRYARGLAEGEEVRRGQVIGFVGSSGNAPEDAPHLHFAVMRHAADANWWEGEPIDPYDLLVVTRTAAADEPSRR